MQIHVSVPALPRGAVSYTGDNIASLYPFYDARYRKVLTVTEPYGVGKSLLNVFLVSSYIRLSMFGA